MPLSPSDVQHCINSRYDIDKICESIDNALRKSDYVGAQVWTQHLPLDISINIADRYRELGWTVKVSTDEDRNVAATVFNLSFEHNTMWRSEQ